MSIAARDKTIVKINNKLKRNNLFGLGFVSLIAACGRSENISTPPETSELDEEAIQAIIDAAVKAAILKTRNDAAREAEEAAQAARDAEAERLAEEASYTPVSTRITRVTTVGEDPHSSINVVWSGGKTTFLSIPNARFIADPVSGAEFDANKGRASLHDLGGDVTKADLLINIPTFDGDDCDADSRGLVAIYWDIQYGFDLDSNHLRIIGESDHNEFGREFGREGVSFYNIGDRLTGQLDMIISSRLVDRDTRMDVGAIYIIWDVKQYTGASQTIYLATKTGSGSKILAIKGGSAGDRIGDGYLTIAKINNNDNPDLIIEEPDVAGGKGALYIVWDIEKTEYQDGKNIDLTKNAAGILKIYGRNSTNNLGEDGRSFIFEGSDGAITLKDFDNKGTHDIVFYDGYHTYLLLGEKFLGSNRIIDIAEANFLLGRVIDYGGYNYTRVGDPAKGESNESLRIEFIRAVSVSGEIATDAGFRVNRKYTDVNTFYNDIVVKKYDSQPHQNLMEHAHDGAHRLSTDTPFGPSANRAEDKVLYPIREVSTATSSAALSDIQEDGIWDIA